MFCAESGTHGCPPCGTHSITAYAVHAMPVQMRGCSKPDSLPARSYTKKLSAWDGKRRQFHKQDELTGRVRAQGQRQQLLLKFSTPATVQHSSNTAASC